MILVLIFFGVIIFLMILFLFILSLKIKINIDTIKLENNNNRDIKMFLDIYFLNKFKLARIKLDNIKFNKIKNKLKEKEIKISNKDKKIDDILKYAIKNKNVNIAKLNLDMKIGLIDGIATSISIAVLSTVISIFLSRLVKEYSKDNICYKIIPIYSNEITIKILLSCIIEVKLVHIIYMIYVLLKKGRVRVNERTSNRRSYAYSYE